MRQETELVQKKKADDERLAALKMGVEKKRKAMGSTTLSSLSPEKTLTDMKQIDAQIKEIKEQFRQELANGTNQISERFKVRLSKLAEIKKDEFETNDEFKTRTNNERNAINTEQSTEIAALKNKMEKELNLQITPFVEQLNQLSGNNFTLTAENLILELGTYDAVKNAYPVSIKAKQPIQGILIAANANIPIPREEARELKQHFTNNMLRPEIKGNFQMSGVFTIAQSYVIDDATTKRYYLFPLSRIVDLGDGTLYDTKTKLILDTSTRFVDLDDGTIYDTKTKLTWDKNDSAGGQKLSWNDAISYINRLNQTAYLGFRDWRMPTKEELNTLVEYANGAGGKIKGIPIYDFLNKQGFSGFANGWYWSSTEYSSNFVWLFDFDFGTVGGGGKGDAFKVRAVRSF